MTSVKAVTALTAPVEDYLKVIFELEASGGVAGTNEIAAELGVAPPSVSGMIRRLAEQGLIAHERYRGVRLTKAGRRAALRTIRRHRVIEAYLTTALGYPWDRVHDEAERLEHAASDELIDRMAAAIGEPTTDPHGAPIPTRDGTLDEPPLVTLAAVDVWHARAACNASAIATPSSCAISPSSGSRRDRQVEVLSRAPFDGPISLARRPSDAVDRAGAGESDSRRADSFGVSPQLRARHDGERVSFRGCSRRCSSQPWCIRSRNRSTPRRRIVCLRTVAIDERLAADAGVKIGDRLVLSRAPGGDG